MDTSKPILPAPRGTALWRHAALAAVIVGSLFWIVSLGPIAQNAAYHFFADTREVMGIPNFFDVISNLPFLLIGLAGLRFCLQSQAESMRSAWIVLFFGVGLVGAGSAYYHWEPTNESLVWDRLPMTMGFMGLLVALLGEYVDNQLAAYALIPAVVLGLASVAYWHFIGDLRPYYWIQLVPLLTIPSVMVLFRSRYSHQWLLIVALSWYILAKIAESYDLALFHNTQELLSGHSLKHLLAGAGCYSILVMLQRRKPVE